VVDTARVVRMNNLDCFALAFLSVSAVYFGHAESLRDLGIFYNSVAIDTHCSYMHEVAFRVIFHNGKKNIQGRLSIIRISFLNSSEILHRIWC